MNGRRALIAALVVLVGVEVDPSDSAASSTNAMPQSRAIAAISSSSTGCPNVCIGEIAAMRRPVSRLIAPLLVRSAIASSRVARACASMPSVTSELSTKCGTAPQ